MGENRWIVGRTKPTREPFAAGQLRRNGLIPYCPVYWDGHKQRRLPLFATYIFIAGASAIARTTIGIRRLVTFGSELATVAPAIIASLQARENEHGCIVLQPKPSFQPDDPVRITGGPFANHLALYQGQSRHQRVQVLMDLLGQSTSVSVDQRYLEAA